MIHCSVYGQISTEGLELITASIFRIETAMSLGYSDPEDEGRKLLRNIDDLAPIKGRPIREEAMRQI